MTLLLIGLVLFLGIHSVRIVADDWRTARVAALGLGPWKGIYSVIAIVGFVLICVGYPETRLNPVDLWTPPVAMRHLAASLTLPAFILLVAGKIPGTRIKQAVKHPMVAGVKAWAIAHLLSNGRLGDVVLFGAVLLWAILDYRAARQRDRAQGLSYPAAAGIGRDIATVAIGTIAWFVFARYLHVPLIGVSPFRL